VRVERQEPDRVFPRGIAVPLGEQPIVSGGADQRLPLFAEVLRRIEDEMEVDVDKAGQVLGTLDVAADPVHGIRHAAQHPRGSERVRYGESIG
jgi:hypothetical protein